MTQEDIQVTEIRITDTFRFEGRTYYGLENLRKRSITGYSDHMGTPPYAVRKEESYPCFDSSDSMYEDRSFQAYFLTTDEVKAKAICEETRFSKWEFSRKGIKEQYPVMEPMFSMTKIKEHHLPFIYYHGDGDTMEIVQDRNTESPVEIIVQHSRCSFLREEPDPEPCLYGPPPVRWDDKFYK